MQDYIARDKDKNVVGKWRTQTKPTTPDNVVVEEVNSVTDYEIEAVTAFFP